jgi:hypothetical protein
VESLRVEMLDGAIHPPLVPPEARSGRYFRLPYLATVLSNSSSCVFTMTAWGHIDRAAAAGWQAPMPAAASSWHGSSCCQPVAGLQPTYLVMLQAMTAQSAFF